MIFLAHSGEDVTNLQKVLNSLGFYQVDFTDEFDKNTTNALIQYQLSKQLIWHESNYGAGYLGQQTRSFLEAELIPQVTYEKQTKYYFKPGQSITRAEIAKIAVKIMEEQ